jgi:hypothetical protein
MGTDVSYHGSSNQAAGNSGSMSEGSSFLPCLELTFLTPVPGRIMGITSNSDLADARPGMARVFVAPQRLN